MEIFEKEHIHNRIKKINYIPLVSQKHKQKLDQFLE